MNKITWKSKHFNTTVIATLGKYLIQFSIGKGLTRYVDTTGAYCDANELKILMDELNHELPNNLCACLENGIPKYLKKC